MIKHIMNLATISVMCGSVVILFLIVLFTMLSGGKLILDFNYFGEGWFEIVMLGFFVIPSIMHLLQQKKISTKEYLKRNKVRK